MWPFRQRRQSAEDTDADAELERVRMLRAKTELLADQANRFATQLEALLDQESNKRTGGT